MSYTTEQTMLALSFLSYMGFYETTFGVQVSRRTYRSIRKHLEGCSCVAGEWEIAWGPAMYRLPLTVFDENLMYVVRATREPVRYAIVIRGTNPLSITNWVLQDFNIIQQVRWPYNLETYALEPKLSKGTAMGLQALQHMAPRGVPGDGVPLYRFLAREVARHPGQQISVTVTGHSLGGALAPALALWLADTQTASDDPESPPWDPARQSTIEVFSFAGPSPGNADFAAYYNQRLGATTHRVWNKYDVVPHGWVREALRSLPRLYSPDIAPDLLMGLVLWSTNVLARSGNYAHIGKESAPLGGGKLTPYLRDYAAQMIFQHTAAYPEMLGLLQEIDSTVHFTFREPMRAAVAQTRQDAMEDAQRRGIAQAQASAPLMSAEQRVPARKRLSRGLHHFYRLPATLAMSVLPERVALPRLHARQDCFLSRPRRERQRAQA